MHNIKKWEKNVINWEDKEKNLKGNKHWKERMTDKKEEENCRNPIKWYGKNNVTGKEGKLKEGNWRKIAHEKHWL